MSVSQNELPRTAPVRTRAYEQRKHALAFFRTALARLLPFAGQEIWQPNFPERRSAPESAERIERQLGAFQCLGHRANGRTLYRLQHARTRRHRLDEQPRPSKRGLFPRKGSKGELA